MPFFNVEKKIKKAKNTLFNRENAQTVTISRHIRKKKTQYTHNLRNKLQKNDKKLRSKISDQK